MSAIVNTSFQRRKMAKSKSKQHNDKDPLPSTAAAATTASQIEKNERLLLGRESSKLETKKNYNTVNNGSVLSSSSSSSGGNSSLTKTATTFTTTINSLCNGKITPLVNCCRDINCCLNATTTATCQPVLRDSTTSVSRESSVRRSVSSTGSYLSNKSEHLHSSSLEKQNRINNSSDSERFVLQIHLDLFSWLLFILGALTRFYKLSYPRNVVFDELHYGKFISHYVRHIFFFDQHPPLGKQIIGSVAQFIGFNGNFSVSHIGSEYDDNVPIFWLRFVPALCGSLLPSSVYHLLIEAGISKWYSLLGGLLIVFDNALLTQSRFVLMESMLLLFCIVGLCFLLKFQKSPFPQISWLVNGLAASCLLTCAMCVKYVGFLTFCLAGYLILRYFWDLIYDATKTSKSKCSINFL